MINFILIVKQKSMIQRGSSINKIRTYLLAKVLMMNLSKIQFNKIQDENSDQDFFSALKFVKKRIGPARTEDNRPLFYKKDISLLQEMVLILKLQKSHGY